MGRTDKSLQPPKTGAEALSRAREARKNIETMIRNTEFSHSKVCSSRAGKNIFLKFENRQVTGSFKIRGALNCLHGLNDRERAHGVVAASAGNHSQGVAFSAQKLGVQATIVMPVTSPMIKVTATKSYGANVVLKGDYYDEAFSYAQELAEQKQLTFIHPYKNDHVIAGQGTIALEIFEKKPEIDMIVVPIGGGGLISGIAMVAKAINPRCRVIGVQSERMPGMSALFHGKDVDMQAMSSTIADGIAVKQPSHEMYESYIKRSVDEIVTVGDEEIAATMVFLLERKKTVVEGSGATALTAVFSGKIALGENVAVILSGGNVDINTISKVIQKGLTETGRMARISVVIDDYPGTLNKVTSVIGTQRANILQVDHSRATKDLALRETRVDFLIETNNDEHIAGIRSALVQMGIRVIG